jgi:polyhydroxyalkanoate synthesis regulator phasin
MGLNIGRRRKDFVMQDAWRAYLELALGLTEASRKKAQKVAKKLVGKGGVTAAQLQALAEDLVSTSLANREALSKLVRFEVDRTLGRVGLATAEEVADLTTRVRDLEEELRQARAGTAPATPAGAAATDGAPVAATTAPIVKKTIAKKTVAKKAAVKKAADAPVATGTAPVKKAVARKAVAKKAEPAADAAPDATPAAKAAPPRKGAAKKTAAPRKKATPPAGEGS